MSGHNKWSKIKNKKAVTDAQKSKIFGKLVRFISVESKKAKGDVNAPGLRTAIEKAKEANVPSDNIERAIKKGVGGEGGEMEQIVYESYGPGGSALIIEALTENRNRAAQEIKHILSKNGFTLAGIGSVTWSFVKEITPEDQYKKWSKWPNLETRSLHNYGGDIETWKFGETRSRAQPSKWEFRWPCYHLWFAPAISWNGNILICCSDPHQKEVIGKFPQMSIHNAWTSEKFKSIRDSHLKGKYAGICAKCDVWKEYPDVFFKWQKTKSA